MLLDYSVAVRERVTSDIENRVRSAASQLGLFPPDCAFSELRLNILLLQGVRREFLRRRWRNF